MFFIKSFYRVLIRTLTCYNAFKNNNERNDPMLSYLIVGSGYRSEYYGRIAAKYPGLFRALFLCRSAEKAELVRAHTGIHATTVPSEALAFSPDFVVVAVDRASIADVT